MTLEHTISATLWDGGERGDIDGAPDGSWTPPTPLKRLPALSAALASPAPTCGAVTFEDMRNLVIFGATCGADPAGVEIALDRLRAAAGRGNVRASECLADIERASVMDGPTTYEDMRRFFVRTR